MEQVNPRKSWTRNNRTANGGLVINSCSDQSPMMAPTRKVAVLYYLSRNGQLDHPHLIDVPLSSPHGLYLKDFINTLNCRRGRGAGNMYSWSFKRSYKNGYVWHDASEEDIIQPSNTNEYVLKGSELHQTHLITSTTSTSTTAETAVVRRHQSWSSFDNPHEYLVFKCESNRELAAKFAPDAATQTEDEVPDQVNIEVSIEDIPSSPPSNSSSEVLEGGNGARGGDRVIEDQHGASGRMKVSRVLMQLITCGADSVRG